MTTTVVKGEFKCPDVKQLKAWFRQLEAEGIHFVGTIQTFNYED